MPDYTTFAPGVYTEEVTATVAISGVSTSIAAFIGLVANTVEMPVHPNPATPYTVGARGVWTLVTSLAQFERKFGFAGPSNRELWLSVKGFFANGGSILYVARIDGDASGGNWALQTDTANPAPAANPVLPPAAAEDPDVLGLAGQTLQQQVDKALERLEPLVSISILAAPGALNTGIQQALVDHAKANQRMAVLDGKHTETVAEASISTAGKSDYSALYYPWIQVSDATETYDKTGLSYVPPSGLMAGIYARVDTTRGVHKAPANEGVSGALGLSYLASANEQKNVNIAGINVIRTFAGSIRVWGARTWKPAADQIVYVNVRRTMIYLARSLELGTQWVVFEPNAYPTWQKVIRSVNAFLTRVWRDGALFGLKAEDAFYVRCDETTNPAENRDAGILTIEVGVAIVRPAEFVVIRISQAAELPTS
jgi:hypothetical protein